MTTPDSVASGEQSEPDPWADLTASLDAMNREAMNRELRRPIGGMYMNDRISLEQFGGFEIPPERLDPAALRRALDELGGGRDDHD